MTGDHVTLEYPTVLPIGTSQHYRWLKRIVAWTLPLNLLDAILTLTWINSGRAVEGNTFIRELAHGDAVVFMLAKLALVSLGIIFLWKNRRHPLAVIAIFVGFFAYYLVFLHHLRYLGANFW